MKISKAKLLVNRKIKQNRYELQKNNAGVAAVGITSAIGAGIVTGTCSLCFLDPVTSLIPSLLVGTTIGGVNAMITKILSANGYITPKKNLVLLKELRKELKLGNNRFQNTEEEEFDENIKKYGIL